MKLSLRLGISPLPPRHGATVNFKFGGKALLAVSGYPALADQLLTANRHKPHPAMPGKKPPGQSRFLRTMHQKRTHAPETPQNGIDLVLVNG
jgi:hypothetical protein